jgi:hypothetical protein
MSNHQFTDKQISNFIKRNKDKKGWLNTRDVRSGNMSSSETRKLMYLICNNHKIAFDNKIAFQDDRYQICFELDQKDRMIEELARFDHIVLTDVAMMDIPSKSLINNKTTPSEFSHWKYLLGDFIRIFKAFCRYQNGQSIDDFEYFEDFEYPDYSDIIGNVDKSLDEEDEKTYKKNVELHKKDIKKHLLLKVRKFISMYKALRIGWKEIKDFYPDITYNTFFIAILREHYDERFVHPISCLNSPEQQIVHSRKTVTLSNFHGNIKRELERLSEEENLDNSDRELYKLTLEQYNREPHGQGFENAFDVLKKVAQKDPQVMQILMDFYHALSIVGRFSEQSIDENFAKFLERDGIGDFVLDYDPKSNDASAVDRVLYQIKDVMRASNDPRVRAAVSDWVEATSKSLNFDVTISRRNEQKSKKDKALTLDLLLFSRKNR